MGVVAIDSGVTDTRTADVAAMFDSHFTAVNAKNYDQALAAYDPAGVINPNDPAQASAYQRDISTTTDDQIVLRGIGPDTEREGRARRPGDVPQQPAGRLRSEGPAQRDLHRVGRHLHAQPAGRRLQDLHRQGHQLPC